jgi:pimeloyl-ACP methyl ester carboxylesterase
MRVRSDHVSARIPATRILAVVVAASAALAGCTSSGTLPQVQHTAADVTSGVPSELLKFYQQQVAWTDCSTQSSGPGWSCGKIEVPLDYSDVSKGTIHIAVTRKKATGDASQRLGSLLLNPGGPGGAGIGYAQDPSVVTKAVAARYDLVGFDPRGVGQSDSVRCLSDDTAAMDEFVSTDPMPRTPDEVAEVVKESVAVGKACEQKSARILPYVGTPNAARDMDVLRGVLGDEKLAYLGKSYGTYLGAVYAQEFPQRTGRLVLDGAIDPTLTSKQMNIAQAQGFEKLIREFVADCAKQPNCPVGTDPNAGVTKLMDYLASLQKSPLPTRDGNRTVNYALGLTAVLQVMYVPQYWGTLRDALTAAMAGDGTQLLQWADLYNDRNNGTYDNQTDANIAINCLDRPDPDAQSAQQIETTEVPDYTKQAPLLGEMLAWADLTCATWPVKPESQPGPITAAGSAPILVVGTKDDPATPYAWAVGLAKQLQNGHLLSWNGSGHTAYTRGSTCIDTAVDAFLINGTLPADGTTCAKLETPGGAEKISCDEEARRPVHS